jgi:hypothetical protein
LTDRRLTSHAPIVAGEASEVIGRCHGWFDRNPTACSATGRKNPARSRSKRGNKSNGAPTGTKTKPLIVGPGDTSTVSWFEAFVNDLLEPRGRERRARAVRDLLR